LRPESITSVDAATRDRWVVQAAEHTLARVATMAHALDRDERGDALTGSLEAAGVGPGLAAGTALAIDHYGTSRAYLAALREVAVAATEVVAGAREAVPDLEIDPDGDGPVEADLTAAPAVPGTITTDGDEGLGAEPAGADAVAPAPGDDAAQPAEPEPDVAAADTAVSDAPTPGADEADVAPEAPAPGPEDPTQTDEAAEPASATDDLGDFEADGVDAAAADDEGGDEPYELDEAEREAVEAEYGTEFSTGSEVGEPGEAGIETETAPPATESPGPADDSPDEAEPPVDDAEAASDGSPATEAPSEEAPDEGTEGADAEPAPDDLEDAVVAAMADLDEGDGAAHDAVVDAVVDAHGVDAEAVEAAIEEALMSGLCYEPTDDRLKAI
jgi:hypothetical protein